jgi:ADP-ribose pyrophosphatase
MLNTTVGTPVNQNDDVLFLLKLIASGFATNLVDSLSPEESQQLEAIQKKATGRKWLHLFNMPYTTKDGKQGVWAYASRKANPQVGTDPIKADAVVIVPLLKNGRSRKLVTIKEFRIPLGDYEHGVPAGLYDPNETAEVVAKRELKEETGLKLTKVLYVSPPCVSSAGLSDESVVYVVCECTGEISNDGNESTEDITINVLDLDQVRALLVSGEKISAKALPYFQLFDALKKIAWPKHMKQEQPKKAKKVDETKNS